MTEMDAIALVKEQDLYDAIGQGKNSVKAVVIQENGDQNREDIKIVQFFVNIMKPFFSRQQGTKGKHDKIIFYDTF